MLKPGGQAVEFFSVSIGGQNISMSAYGADVRRNGLVTTVPVVITEVSTGSYRCDFTVPSDWVGHDHVHVAFTINYFGNNLTTIKHVGTVGSAGLDDDTEYNIDRVLDLLEADETFDAQSGKARKLLRGTNTVLLEKDVTRSTGVDSVSLRE